MIDFPASPTLGQQFTAAGVTWIFDGTKWLPSGLAPTVAPGINDNRIINGDMRIDQRNNGAAGNTTSVFTVDHWSYISNQPNKGNWQGTSSSGLAGFPRCLAFVSTSAYSSLAGDVFFFSQGIEADAVSDFAWGSASAQPVTLSFWVMSSLSGTFSGSVRNYAGTRAYPFTYSLPSANVWTKIAITIPGDTAGTWVMGGNGGAIILDFDLGSGATSRGSANAWTSTGYLGVTGSVSVVATNGAQFYLTGVKLEIGSVATPFNRQSLAKSMADCQRYFCTSYSGNPVGSVAGNGQINWFLTGLVNQVNGATMPVSLPISMRSVPTITVYSPATGASGKVRDVNSNVDVNGAAGNAGYNNFTINWSQSGAGTNLNALAHYAASAEL